MKKRIFTYCIGLFILASCSSALMALSLSGIRLENKKLLYSGIEFKTICFSYGSSSICLNASDIIEIRTTSKPNTITVVSEDYLIIVEEENINAIICNKDKSYIDIKL